VRRYLRAAAIALVAWFGGLGLITVIAEPTASVAMIAPGATALRAAAASDADLLDAGRLVTRVRSERGGFVRDLYAHGAWFVWPAIDGGCLFAAER
jgi:hypothetical protein